MAQRPSSVWSTLNPSLFASLDSGETVHSFLFRSLSEMVGHRASVDQVVGYYFGSVNTWFTVVERASFQRRLEEMAVSPSAETALLILCMLLVIRTPGDHAALGMDDCLYLCVKAAFTLVQNTVSLSLPLLQAQLLVALYEYGHGLPQQAYASLGACMQMTRAFGWQRSVYWTEDRRQALPADLKMASILFWAVVYLDWQVSFPSGASCSCCFCDHASVC
ncbi:hypothetical protein VTK73DRAFT_6253 [Phialemonium thermophilum]|uniref:Xylanolytic transcriptional activator regulatory domain-containing protein n=1 Tax=Phialemonium thermophilum TaxID=223376 RepID=A0ABR3V142_9PEZI